jgi:hypothetical protein
LPQALMPTATATAITTAIQKIGRLIKFLTAASI